MHFTKFLCSTDIATYFSKFFHKWKKAFFLLPSPCFPDETEIKYTETNYSYTEFDKKGLS